MSAELFRKLQIKNSKLVSVNKKLKAEISKLNKNKKRDVY
jgi:cell division protein FtsB